MKDSVVAKVTEIAERVAGSEGLEVIDVELRGGGKARLLRIVIDKPEGVSHGDCEFISKQVGTILDVEDVIPGGSYHLEVSSPGLERPLKKPKDFERFLGRKIAVSLRTPIEERRRWDGVLAGFSEGLVTLEPASGKSVQFTLDNIEKANLKFEW
ncbi:MAG: ribosome maturation factor RimP [Bryobacteraceae bacterium]|nr:ribosome maturation factor RimP [Bryobacteraceae bacterium]HEU0140553.1 ribosome maturation factor RimP [Bryobacteraceae bacterium]